jgi:hypothetical protein
VAVLEGSTYQAVGDAQGVTRERVRQMTLNAIRAAERQAWRDGHLTESQSWSLIDVMELRKRPEVLRAVRRLLESA